jgi:predicted ferric reductase
MDDKIWWYTARAGGIVAFALVTAAVVWGLLLSTRLLGRRPAPKWLLDLHRMLGGLAVVFTVIHMAGLVADTWVHFGVADLLVPLASGWREGAVAWGVVGFYLLVAVEITSLLMRRLPRRVWRAVHAGSYVLFWVAALHGATAGTDAGHPAYRWGSAAAIAAVVFLTVLRIVESRRAGKALRPGGRRTGSSPAPPEPVPAG